MFSYGWRPEMGTYAWIPGMQGNIPHGAVVAGKDVDGSNLYAGRAFHEGDMLPAKITSNGTAYVAYNSTEHVKYEYEFLCGSNMAWQHAKKGDVPLNAVLMGSTSNGEKLYMGRTLHNGSLTPGKVQPSHGVLYIPFNGEELSFEEYEVLVLL